MTDLTIADESPLSQPAAGPVATAAPLNGARVPSPSDASQVNDDPEAPIREADRLEAGYLFDQADEIMRSAVASFPEDPSIFAKYTKMALQRSDWHAALERAKQMRESFPDHAAGYSDGLDALRELCRIDEANVLLKDATAKFAGEPWPLRNAALLAETTDDASAAEEYWDALCTRFPNDADGWLQKAAFYRRCGRLEAADETLREAIELFPHNPSLYIAFGQVAGERRDWDEADRRWTSARTRFPSNSYIALQHALVPVGTPVWKYKNFDEAIARLEKLQEQFPEAGSIPESRVRLLRIRGKLDDAAALALALVEQFPAHAGIGLEHARVLTLKDRRDQAIACLTDLMARSPDSVQVYVELAAALSRAGRWDDAESVCKKAISRFRSPRSPLVEYANIAVRREAWSEALKRWRDALRLYPTDPEIRKGIATTRLAVAAEIEANGGDPLSIETPESEDQGSISDLLMKFESLGAPVWGCEFGFVQRKFGAEPISLLRWASINTHRLIEALETRFEGVGSPEQTNLNVPVDTQMDYHTRDTRYWIELHTFVYRGDVSEERLLQQSLPRIRYLRRKLLEDLESVNKIFLFRPGTAVPAEQLDRLHAAMRSYGDNTLFYVICGDPNHHPGTVEIVKPGLMVGYLSRLSWSPQTGVGTPDFSGWVRLCAEAHRLHDVSITSHASAENAVTMPS